MSEASKNWFDVSRKGLAALVERRGGSGGDDNDGSDKLALLVELVSNALDANGVTQVEIMLEPEEGVPHATVVVRDDSIEGFADIAHAWTLFAESSRKADPEARGRFAVGEKLVLALCTEASIISTKSAVLFDARGRSSMRARRDRGTEFQGIMRITRAELAKVKAGLKKIIAPPGIAIVVNGEKLPARQILKTVETTLPTEIADEGGVLRRSARKTTVNIYDPLPGEEPMLYELGIPVVATGDKFHVDVQQKTVLNMDRDNVTPGYLRAIRTLVVNALHDQLTEDDGNATFVNEAIADKNATSQAVKKALDLKFTEKHAIRDPNDPEANNNLVAEGYTLISGSQLTKEQWDNVKRLPDETRPLPSGQIRPTKKALFGPGGKDTWVPREKWTPTMHRVVEYAIDVCRELLGHDVRVGILSDITESWAACFGNQGLVFNLGRLGHDFFNECAQGPTDRLNQLLIHELGHGMPGGDNHLAEAYHEGLCKLGAKLARLALTLPNLFAWKDRRDGVD